LVGQSTAFAKLVEESHFRALIVGMSEFGAAHSPQLFFLVSQHAAEGRVYVENLALHVFQSDAYGRLVD
jgi:hypothetical protein